MKECMLATLDSWVAATYLDKMLQHVIIKMLHYRSNAVTLSLIMLLLIHLNSRLPPMHKQLLLPTVVGLWHSGHNKRLIQELQDPQWQTYQQLWSWQQSS
nr:hypothetical protein [Tanacetum cinerariifolium]